MKIIGSAFVLIFACYLWAGDFHQEIISDHLHSTLKNQNLTLPTVIP